MMFLLDAPADTFNFMVYGFTVILGFIGLYILSLVIRYRNLRRDLELLEEVEAEK
ncbi:MAG: hypothetical protein GTO18_06055 [Anaerolineales bacterium]|nr:hypothetical protein [Anaerolineales bacterium]